jgi:hypothetical protein
MILAQEGIMVDLTTVIALVGVLGSTIAVLFKLLVMDKDAARERAEKRSQNMADSLEKIASEAVRKQLLYANMYRQKVGMEPIVPVEDVIPESSSPPTHDQYIMGRIATLRATMAAVEREMETGSET